MSPETPENSTPNKIVYKMDPVRIAIGLVMTIIGIGLVVWNFTPDEFGYIRISLYMIVLEAFLIIFGVYFFFKNFKAEFCGQCNKSLELESHLYPLREEQKIRDYLNNYDKKALASAEEVTTNIYENLIQLNLEYCKQCKDVGYAEIVAFDEKGRRSILVNKLLIGQKHLIYKS